MFRIGVILGYPLGVMEKQMETIGPCQGIYRVIGGILGFYGDNMQTTRAARNPT